MPDEFEQDGVLSIWTQRTLASLSRAWCRTTDMAAATLLVPGIETACPVNWPSFANHREFKRNYVFSRGEDKCHDTVEQRLRAYWDRHNMSYLLEQPPTPWPPSSPPPPSPASSSSSSSLSSQQAQAPAPRPTGRFLAVFRCDGFSYAWLQNNFDWQRIILAHQSLYETNAAETKNVAYPVMPLTVPTPTERVAITKDPCRARPVFGSFQGTNTWSTRAQLLQYSHMPDVRIHLQENTRSVQSVVQLEEEQQAGRENDDNNNNNNKQSSSSGGGVGEYQADYLELLRDSVFTFAVRGHNQFSFRFPEAMASGSLPVVLSDGWHLPFWDSPAIDYANFTLVFKESEVGGGGGGNAIACWMHGWWVAWQWWW
jgi:hypothetical protein